MATGEGKTLVSTLPAYLNALAGEGVHIVTVMITWPVVTRNGTELFLNGWVLQLIVLINISQTVKKEEKLTRPISLMAPIMNLVLIISVIIWCIPLKKWYNANIILPWWMKWTSVLIDDARTPLIISGPVPKGDDQQYHILKPRVLQLVEAQERIVAQYFE